MWPSLKKKRKEKKKRIWREFYPLKCFYTPETNSLLIFCLAMVVLITYIEFVITII